MNDRTIGYLCISFTVTIAVVLTFFLVSKSSGPAEIRIIEFPDISGLSFINKDDPVTLKGMVIGKVLSTKLNNDKIFVTIYSNRHINIHSDYCISIGAQGVMGDRFLNIEPGINSQTDIPKEQHLKGIILPSPPEAISRMKHLIAAIQELNNLSKVLLYGDSSGESFISTFKRTVETTDMLSYSLSKKSKLTYEHTSKIMDTINSLIAQYGDLKKTFSRHIPPALDSIDTILWTGLQKVEQVDSALLKTGEIIKKYHNQDFSSFDENISTIHNGLCSLSVLLDSIREKGLFFPIRLK